MYGSMVEDNLKIIGRKRGEKNEENGERRIEKEQNIKEVRS